MTTIDNLSPRLDTQGEIIDAHDGCLEHFGGRYWLYGTRYGDTDGYQNTNIFVSYSSPDLEHWTPLGPLIPDLRPSVCYRPYVKYCEATRQYVLWHYWTTSWRGTTKWRAGDGPPEPFRFAVSVSDRPEGPFRTVNDDVPMSRPSKGDHNLFVDNDNVAYIVYSSPRDDFSIAVERLTPDYLRSTGETSAVLTNAMEAPCMLGRGEYYYVLAGRTCCFCPDGSGAQVYRSTHSLGPYESRNNINRASDATDVPIELAHRIIIPGQQTNIARLLTTAGPAFIWMSDLWESAPDAIKGHDLQYWSPPLRFDSAGDIVPLEFVERWSVEVSRSGAVQ